jgi:glycosyltransferase involved in cell wall biosynthesis
VDRQSFRDFEIIVIDDGSGDATAAWLRTHGAGLQVLALEKSGGAARARNLGIDRARGEVIAFLDDDDVWDPEYLAAQVECLDAHPLATLSYADHVEINSSGHPSRPDTQPLLNYPNVFVRLLAESFIHTMSVVISRRDAFERFGRFNESLNIVHDLDWYRRVLAGGGTFVQLSRPLVKRSVPGGLVTLHREWFREERAAHAQALAGNPVATKHERLVRAYRSLFFARIGLGEWDWRFGLARLAGAIVQSPYWTIRIALLRLLRRMRFDYRIAQ